MRIRSLVTGAVLGALTLSGVSMPAAADDLQTVGPADPNALTTFNVYLPLTHSAQLDKLLSEQTDSSSSNYHKWLSPAQFKQQFGPKPSDVARAKSMLEAAGFTILAEHTQNIQVQGHVADVQKLFSTQLNTVKDRHGHHMLQAGSRGRLTLPQSLAAMGAVIPEYAPHLASQVHSQVMANGSKVNLTGKAGTAAGSTEPRLATAFSFYYPDDLNEAYDFPSFLTEAVPPHSHHRQQIAGVGSTIGIVISSVILPTDLHLSFNSTVFIDGLAQSVQNYDGVSNLPEPTVVVHPVNGGSGPFVPFTADSDEASLDTQMSLGTAPGAKEILYDMPALDDASIVAAYTQVDEENLVDVASSSFGECEKDFLAINNHGTDFTGILQVFHDLFRQGNSQGITFVASSGDQGAPTCLSTAFQNNPTLNGTNFELGVQNPASDPNVTGVGGTNLLTQGTPTPLDVTRVSENAQFDSRFPAVFAVDANGNPTVTVGNNTWGSGGGFSVIFDKPLYQFLVNTGNNRHRAVPDVSLQMGGCPLDADDDCANGVPQTSATLVWIGGSPNLLIGTSAAAPEIAGVLALAVELNGGRLGNVNPLIYGLSLIQTLAGGEHAPKPFQYFHRDITGDNNGFTVKPGQAFSEVLGNGTLDVRNFLGLHNAQPAGAPNTPSNP
ncbi:MAG TPA: S53 family serine peptidase [Steroidobacteraceae bacterium]|nr:S53 family serine peptidase [Steroidobacteraceae bacterium]